LSPLLNKTIRLITFFLLHPFQCFVLYSIPRAIWTPRAWESPLKAGLQQSHPQSHGHPPRALCQEITSQERALKTLGTHPTVTTS